MNWVVASTLVYMLEICFNFNFLFVYYLYLVV